MGIWIQKLHWFSNFRNKVKKLITYLIEFPSPMVFIPLNFVKFFIFLKLILGKGNIYNFEGKVTNVLSIIIHEICKQETSYL